MILNLILDNILIYNDIFSIDTIENFNNSNNTFINSEEYYSDIPKYNYCKSTLGKIKNGIKTNITPWYITGFTDGEGCFSVSITDKGYDKLKVGLQYKVTQKANNEHVLEQFIDYFDTGKIYIDNKITNTLKYQVQDINSITNKIIPHFEKYSLNTSKVIDFKDWVSFKDIVIEKYHFNIEGKKQLLNIKNNINNSRSNIIRWCYINSIYKSNVININPNWLQGFIDAEGSFQFRLADQVSRNSNYIAANPTFEIAQSNHDVQILLSIIDYLHTGYIKPKFNINSIIDTLNSRSVSRYITNNESKIIELLDKYPLKTSKRFDYEDWKILINIKEQGLHKTIEGREEMQYIKNQINKNRK